MDNRPRTLCTICESHETNKIAENKARHTYICHDCGGIYEVNSQYLEFILGDPYCSEEEFA